MEKEKTMSSWSELPQDLLMLIFRKTRLIQDICRFQMVCKIWQLTYKQEVEEMLDGSWPKVPALMLTEKEGSDEREFFSLQTEKNWKGVSYLPEARQSKCMESLGWLITIESKPSGEQKFGGHINLLHPFTRVQIPLPSLKTIEGYEFDHTSYYVEKAVLSANPSKTSNYIVVLAFSHWCCIGFWKSGDDEKWTKIDSKIYNSYITKDIIFYKGKLYGVTDFGCILVYNVLGPNPTTFMVTRIDSTRMILYKHYYLVESSGELLVITRDTNIYGETFKVFEVDLINKGSYEISTLGGERAIFIGYNSSFSIEVNCSPDILKPNRIYFTFDFDYYSIKEEWENKVGIYHIEDGTTEYFNNVQSFSHISPSVWIRPSL